MSFVGVQALACFHSFSAVDKLKLELQPLKSERESWQGMPDMSKQKRYLNARLNVGNEIGMIRSWQKNQAQNQLPRRRDAELKNRTQKPEARFSPRLCPSAVKILFID